MRSDNFKGVSPSQLDAAACRLAWHLGYRLGYRPRRVSKSLDLGTGIHAALEALYKSGADPVGAFVEWCAARRAEISPQWEDDARAMDEIEDLGTVMLAGYVDRYGDDPGFEVLATEATLTARIPVPGKNTLSRYTMTARLDGIIRDLDSGRLFSLEHKTYRSFSAAHFDLDHQFTAQVWLGQQCLGDLGLEGEEIIGVLYNGLRKAVPTKRTTAPLFVREKIFRTRAQIDAFLHRAYNQCRDLSTASVRIYPQPNPMRCGTCSFRDPCIAYQRGEDMGFILDNMYTSRAEREAAAAGGEAQ